MGEINAKLLWNSFVYGACLMGVFDPVCLVPQYHGISVKSCYTDFDRHHRGFITESQVRV